MDDENHVLQFGKSHPAWDAWIEISMPSCFAALYLGRIPHGMRGLKYIKTGGGRNACLSHPAWDAWIEITFVYVYESTLASRIPHGMRGLKSISIKRT